MKIAYLLGSLNRGGTETLLLDVLRNAHKNGLEAICIYRKEGVYLQEFIESGVPVFYLKFNRNLINYLFRLRSVLLMQNVECVHAQQPLDALFAYFALSGTGVKVLLTLHGFDYNENSFEKLIRSFALKHTTLNIYVSLYQKNYYLEKYRLKPERQKLIYNGISFDKLKVNEDPVSVRTEFGFSEDTLILGTVGNFVPVRDQITICRFLNLLNASGVQFQFLFIGKKSEKYSERYDECVDFVHRNQLVDKVHFIGSRNDVPRLLGSMDAFIYATDHDTFGIAVVEAMATGVPVFVNDWAVMNEITDNGHYATLYKTRDIEDLLSKFLLFLQNKELYKKNSCLSAVYVNEYFSIKKHIENLKATYSRLSGMEEKF